jgi:general secretion pathway protein K
MTMCNPPDAPRQASADGFILIAVLWIVAALATLASIFSVYLANTAVFLSLNDNTIQSEALVYAGLELTAYAVSAPKPAANLPATAPRDPNSLPPPTHGTFNFRMGRANVAVNFITEAARIDLNLASTQVVANFFAGLGIQRQEAQQYAERIEGWTLKPRPRSTFATPSQDDEEALYRAAGRSYSPRGGPFAHIDELSLVLGLPPAIVERAKPFLTIYGGSSQIDVLDAAPEVLAAIPGMSPNLMAALADARRTADPKSIAGLLVPLQGVASVEGGDTYRVQVHVRYDKGRQETSEVVIVTGLTDKPYRVLYWRDGIDVPLDLARPPLPPR